MPSPPSRAPPGHADADAPRPARSGTRLATGRVLVVENDDAMREALRDLLEDAGYGVVCARDGVEALAALRREAICFVLLDLHLPTMDGFELRRRQLEDPALASVPVAVLTSDAHGTLGDTVPVIWKPFAAEDLLKVVRACCARGDVTTPTVPPAAERVERRRG